MTHTTQGHFPDLPQDGTILRLYRRWKNATPRGEFWALVIATLLFNMGTSIFMFLYNLFMLDLGYRERSLGILISALALGSMAGTIPLGMLAKRFGVKRVLASSLLLLAVAFAAKVCFLWYPAQVAFSFLDGLLLCGWVVCIAPAVASVVEESKRPVAFSILFSTAVGVCALGGFLGGNLPELCQRLVMRCAGIAIPDVTGKKMTLVIASCIIGLAAWPITRITSEPRTQEARWSSRPSPFLLRFLLANACWGAAIGAFNPFANVYFVNYMGVHTSQLGNYFTVAQFVQAGAVLLMPFVLRKTGLISGIMLTQLTTAAALAILASRQSLLQVEVIYCGFMAVQHMSEPAIQNLLMNRVMAEERSVASAMNFFVISIAQAISAAVAGFAFARFGYPRVLICIAVAIGIAAIIFRLLCSPHASVAPLSQADLVR